MYPVVFRFGDLSIHGYGLMIAIGAFAGVFYMARQGKKELNLSFDQANYLFLIIFAAAFIGGKFFLFLEDPSDYLAHPARLFRGSGFVFYGSFLFAVPCMLLFFQRHALPAWSMLDIMAITTCLVHFFGRLGCFLAGCCYGIPTDFIGAVVFTDPACVAEPKGVPLHPTQLYEAGFILIVLFYLLWLRDKKQFQGQLFILYLGLYGAGRFILEYFRGDSERGFVMNGLLSHSQLISLLLMTVSAVAFFIRRRKA